MKKNTLENQQSNDTWFGCSVGVFLTGALVLTTAFSAVVLRTNLVSADDVIDDVSITIPVSCSMSGNIDTAHTASMQPNTYSAASGSTYENGIGKTTLTTFCNDQNGFSIYAIGYTGDTEGNNTLVGTATSSYATIATGLATSGATSNWAMKVNKVENPQSGSPVTYNPQNMTITNSFNNYHAVPDAYTKVAEYHAQSGSSATDMGTGALGAKIETTYAAFISSTQLADTYTGQVKYTMVHPYDGETPPSPQTTETGCIRYYANASDAVGTMGCQEVSASDTSATLLASNFSRYGYGFAGWSDAFDYATNANANFYGPQEDIAFAAGQYTGSNNGLSLYAVWVPSAGSIQNWNGCSGLTKADQATNVLTQSITALTDQRDNETYAVAKLADGNCWMIENLRLESTAAHNSDGTLAQGYGTSATYGNFSGLATAESTNFHNSTTANSLYYSGTQSGTAAINIGTSNYPGYRMPRYNNLNVQSRASNPTSNTFSNNITGGMYSYGNYYTWHAAIANLTYNGTNNSSVTNTSLCPSGWRLPKGGNKSNEANNDFWSLVVTGINGGTNPANYDSSTAPYYNSTAEAGPVANKLRAYPNNFLYSGSFSTPSVFNRGSTGSYWSSTAGGSYGSYGLSMGSSSVSPATFSNDKYYGRSIRCTSGT